MDDTIYLLDPGASGLTARLRQLLTDQHGISRVVCLQELRARDLLNPSSFGQRPTFLWRIKNRPPHTNTPVALREYFIEQEWFNALLGLHWHYPGRCINDPSKAQRAASKPLQLGVATSVGLATPRSIVTNDKSALLEFARAADASGIVLKPLDTTYMGNPHRPGDSLRIGLRIVTPAEIDAFTEAQMQEAPVIAQARVAKKFELRVVVYGDAACFVRIDSQKHSSSSLDWRLRQADASMYSLMQADSQLTNALRRYLDKLGLFSGVFDLAVTPEDEVIFFECNANGEWMWIDNFLAGAISAMAARELADYHCGVSHQVALASNH